MGYQNVPAGQRQCYKCIEIKPLYLFYKDSAHSTGYRYICRDCCKNYRQNNKEYFTEYRKNNRDKFRKGFEKWRINNPEQYRANQMTVDAIRRGKLKRLPCIVCNNISTHAHHEDYSKPLEITWLCSDQHYKRHRLGFL